MLNLPHFRLLNQTSIDLAEDDWGISVLTMCPFFTDTTMLKNVGKYSRDDVIVSPGVPELPCKAGLSTGLNSIDIMRYKVLCRETNNV